MAGLVPPGNLPLCTHRYLLLVSYLGSKFHGSQRLVSRDDATSQNTVQEALEWSLEKVLPKQRCKLTAASRTDSGVHALINCYTLPLMDFSIPTVQIKRALNSTLIKNHHDVCVSDVVLAPAAFHPRIDVVGREYIYRLAVFNDQKPPLSRIYHSPHLIAPMLSITDLHRVLAMPCFDIDRALEVIDLLKGKHDYASFIRGQENVNNTVRDLDISITKLQPFGIDHERPLPYCLYHISFKSRSFLYNQVRRLVGAIISYASYQRVKLDRIKYMLDNPDGRNWPSKMIVAQPCGLFLSRLIYRRSALQGAMRTNDEAEEAPVEEWPPTIGLSDEEPAQEEGIQDEKVIRGDVVSTR